MTIDREGQHRMWEALTKVAREHRSFADAKWAMASSDIDRLESIAELLKPEDVVTTVRWLFDSHLPDFGAGKRSDLPDYDELLATERRNAVESIFSDLGWDGLVRLADEAEQPWPVGAAAADAELPVDSEILNLLDDERAKLVEMAFAFCARRVGTEGWGWIEDSLNALAERPLAQGRLLRTSDELPRAWATARELGPEVDDAYWREFVPLGRGPEFPLANEAAEQLLRHRRPGTALDLLNLYIGRGTQAMSPELIADALDSLVPLDKDDPELRRVSSYELENLLEHLRNAALDEDRIAALEWKLLPGLGFQARSPTLHRKLARDPAFFVEILSLAYRPKSGGEVDVAPEIASNAFRLLREWRIVPGSVESRDQVDEATLRDWVEEARRRLTEMDRLSVGEVYIGHVFAHAPEDDDGSWPTEAVRNVIEWAQSTSIEEGFATEIFNKRGVTSRALDEGGKQERELAAKYGSLAQRVADRWPRTAGVLRSVAQGYERDAKREDEQAERFLGGHED